MIPEVAGALQALAVALRDGNQTYPRVDVAAGRLVKALDLAVRPEDATGTAGAGDVQAVVRRCPDCERGASPFARSTPDDDPVTVRGDLFEVLVHELRIRSGHFESPLLAARCAEHDSRMPDGSCLVCTVLELASDTTR